MLCDFQGTVVVLSASVKVANTARDLGVYIDRSLTMSDHVAAVCRAAYFQLRQLRLITRSLTADAAKSFVQAFITCRLDYCNSLFSGISDSLFRRLQSVQNAAARLVTGTSRCDHITPVLRELHWLPVRQRVEFKLAVFVYKCLHGLTAPYLIDDCQLVANSGRRRLRSADVDTYRTSNEHPARRQELRRRRSTVLEYFTSRTPSAGH